MPSADVRAWRGLIEYRRRLMDRRVAVKNQVRALLRSLGVSARAGKALWSGKARWSGKGLAWLAALALDSPDDALRRDLLAEELEGLTRKVKRVEKDGWRRNWRPGRTGTRACGC